VGLLLASRTDGIAPSGTSPPGDPADFYQKLVVWVILYEMLGLGASCGPLRVSGSSPGSRLHLLAAPWHHQAAAVAGAATRSPVGSRRTWFDVFLYVGMIVSAIVLLFSDGVPKAGQPADSVGLLDPRLLAFLIGFTLVAGLRDRLLFLAARSEQYWVMCIMFAALPFVDMIVGAKLVMCAVWWGAAASKIGKHFGYVIQGMTTNAPLMVSKWLRHKLCKDFPNRHPGRPGWAGFLGHTPATVLEFGAPVILLFRDQPAGGAGDRRHHGHLSTCTSPPTSRWRCRWSGTSSTRSRWSGCSCCTRPGTSGWAR